MYLGKKELESRIVWIHREPVDQIKSLIPLILATRSRFEHDLGLEDMDWLNKTAINITEILLKNAIATRDEWVKQDPEREKQILDIGFRDAVSRPKETVQHIYQYFGIDYTEDVDKSLIHTIEEGDPQKKHGRKARDTSLFRFNDDDIRERFKFYYERFSKYMPNYYPSK
ncbi:Protein-tyrosine sulfotransferase [Entamoeba marina]